jgi:Asp/Glu/hydantoin racemase
MTKRIFILHPTSLTVEPIEAAFRRNWPQARRLNLVDESLYDELDADGTITPAIRRRIRLRFEYCVEARADAIMFNGTTFGPAVDDARADLPVPVLKPIEALASDILASGRKFVVLSASKRSIPVILAEIEAATAGHAITLEGRWVADAREAIMSGDVEKHDRLVVEAAEAVVDCDAVVLGQVPMASAGGRIKPRPGRAVLTSPDSAVLRLKKHFGA